MPSYPHPRLMQDFWEFPTVSMGLGPMNAIYQARFNHYLHDRGIKDTSDQHVWAFLGDGEMDEPESRGLAHVAALEGLDNLTFVVNCNLQRLDGPVRGNGKIIQELESFFRGAGWNVIKVVWGREWDTLLHADRDGALVNLMNTTPDGDYQTYKANDGAYVRDHFFGRDPRTKALVADMTDSEIWNLKRGGHDYRKVYAAYRAAVDHKGQPTVILAKTIKGYSLGAHFQGRNATHQMKKLALQDLKDFRDAIRIPISDEQLEQDPYLPPYYHPGPDAPEIRYLLDRRRTLGGFVPERRTKAKAVEASRSRYLRPAEEGLRAAGSRHHHGDRAHIQGSVAGQRGWPADRADHSRRGPHVRHGLLVPVAEDLQPPRPAVHRRRRRPDAGLQGERRSARSCTRASTRPVRRLVHRGRHVVRDPQRADDPDLHLLFDVRVPAHRRRPVGRGRPDGPRLPARGHRRTDHADRRGSAARRRPLVAACGHQSGSGLLRPSVRLRDRLHRRKWAGAGCSGENPENIYFYITVYNEPYVQPPEPENFDPEGVLRGIYRYHAATERRTNKAQILASGVAMPAALQGGRDAGRRMGRRRRRLVGDQLGRAEPRRRRGARSRSCVTPTARPASPT